MDTETVATKTGNNMIELNNVTKLYGTVIGVNDISLSLPPGTYGLLGPNGSGKTTLINLILGQLRPTIGSVRLFGTNPWARSRLLSWIGLCPAIEVNYPRMTGYDWVRYLVQLHGYNASVAHDMAVSALEQVKLADHMNRPMRNYSLGMRQRAKLAQAIAHNPELLILDEPFSGLDPIGRFEMTEMLKRRAAEGQSIILASHILHEVEAINPSFLLISGGRLLASGSPEEVRSILADTPSKFLISCSDARKLATLLVDRGLAMTVEIASEEDLIVQTDSASKLQSGVPAITKETGVVIYDMNSDDDSLKTLFTTLMQIHRGETRKGTLV